MTASRTERRLRDALVAAMLPAPGRGLPGAGELDLGAFWPRFEASAPVHVRIAFRAATFALGVALPRLLGHRASLAELDADVRDDVLVRGASMRGFAELLDIAKVVVCMAYFADDDVQAVARGRR